MQTTLDLKVEEEKLDAMILVASLQKDSNFIARAVLTQMSRTYPSVPVSCTWCGAAVENVTMYRCWEKECFEMLHACGPCIVLAHEQRPWHSLEKWSLPYGWENFSMSKLGYVYQSGHDGLPCPNPSPDTHDRLLYARGFTWTIPIRDCLCYAEEKRVAAKTAAAAQAEEYTKELESS